MKADKPINPESNVFAKKYSVLFLLLFFFAVACIFLLQNHTNGFNTEHHGFTSSRGAVLSKSLMVDNKHLVMLLAKQMLDNGEIYYHPYNRFPVFPFLVTGVAMQAFEPNLAMQIYVARQVMNLFIIGALILCFLLTDAILKDKYLSLTTTFFIFSSYYILYYNDMIFNDTPSIFGFVLALFLVVKEYTGNLRRSRIILLSLISISVGWQPYAVFIAWLLVDVFNQIRSRKVKDIVRTIINRPSFIAFASSVAVGVLILGAQFINEWSVRGGSMQEVPSMLSMRGRLGLRTDGVKFEWGIFWLKQAYHIFNMIVPFSGILTGIVTLKQSIFGWISGVSFVIVSGVLCIYGLVKFRQKINLTILYIFVLSGFCWAVPMRHFTAYHDYQSPFYIGLSIMFYIVLSHYIKPAFSKAIAIGACLLFILSVFQMNAIKSVDAQRFNAITEDFQNIYAKLPKNSKVFVDCAGKFGKDKFGMDYCRNELSADLGLGGQSLDFYLVGHYRASVNNADFVISMNPHYNQNRLTNNPKINLFNKSVINKQ
ncbi:MAG: hypothetical protein HZB61_06695 [Nitrospirae bacterium]|nr:hypothetical protein [Nitrospirota bacterium]